GRKPVARFAANGYLDLSRAVDLFDVARPWGSLEAALDRVQSPVLVVGVSSDILYPTYQQKESVDTRARLGKDVEYAEIDSPHGHDGFLIDFPKMEPILREVLETGSSVAAGAGR